MILASIFFQTFTLFIGFLLAKKVISNHHASTLTFEEAYHKSMLLWIVSFFSIGIMLLNAYAFHHDAFFLTFPLLYQKYAMVVTWVVIISYLSFMSGFTLYVTYVINNKKFKIYLLALMLLNVLLSINHYQKNAYGGEFVKDINSTEQFVKQSTNYSCTSASISTVARGFKMEVSEKEVAKLSRLTRLGANAGQVRFTLNKLGIQYHSLTAKFTNPEKIKAPAILYVDNSIVGYEGHAIVYLGKSHYGYKIWDPVGLNIYLSEEELREIWHGNGVECFSAKTTSHHKEVTHL
jgi:predicted double-glycine peptidase